jgi:FixJ family two-component response regulator
MKMGACAFLLKPFGDLELLSAVQAAFAANP